MFNVMSISLTDVPLLFLWLFIFSNMEITLFFSFKMKGIIQKKKNSYNFIFVHFKPHTFIIMPNIWKLWNTWDHRWGFVWHNNESMWFKTTHLKVWGLICHKDKTIELFLDFPLKCKSCSFFILSVPK